MNPPDVYATSPAYVLDASALLAFSHGEEGAALGGPLLGSSAILSFNRAEVLRLVAASGLEVAGKREDMESLGLLIHPFAHTPSPGKTLNRQLYCGPWGGRRVFRWETGLAWVWLRD